MYCDAYFAAQYNDRAIDNMMREMSLLDAMIDEEEPLTAIGPRRMLPRVQAMQSRGGYPHDANLFRTLHNVLRYWAKSEISRGVRPSDLRVL